MEIKDILHKSLSKRSFRHKIHSLLRRTDAIVEALTSFTVYDAYRPFAGQADLLRSESRSRIEYLIPTNNITMFDSYFKLANKSYLIHRLWYDLVRFLIIW